MRQDVVIPGELPMPADTLVRVLLSLIEGSRISGY
jgi:hypothetical protein